MGCTPRGERGPLLRQRFARAKFDGGLRAPMDQRGEMRRRRDGKPIVCAPRRQKLGDPRSFRRDKENRTVGIHGDAADPLRPFRILDPNQRPAVAKRSPDLPRETAIIKTFGDQTAHDHGAGRT